MSRELTAAGFPTFNYPFVVPGIGFQLYMARTIVSFSFNKNTRTTNRDTYSKEEEYRATSFSVGYNVLKGDRYALYPYLGFKGSGLNYLYRERFSTTVGLQDYLQTNLEYKEITNSRGHLDLGIGAARQAFTLFNLRAGYLLPLEKVRWNINNNDLELNNAPSIDYRFYFTLTVGLGYIFRE